MFHGHTDDFQKLPLGGRPNTKPRDHGTPNAHNHWFILFSHVWRPTRIEFHWNSIWLRARSHMISHYTWGSVTTRHDVGGVLGRPLHTSFWALTIEWSRLLARVWSGPKCLDEVPVGELAHSSRAGGALTKHFLDHVLRSQTLGLVLAPNNGAFLEYGGFGSSILEVGFGFLSTHVSIFGLLLQII